MRLFNFGGQTHILPRKNVRCRRCGLRYLVEESKCPHCLGMTDEEIIHKIHIPHAKQQKEHRGLGLSFAVITLVIFVVLIGSGLRS